MGFTKDVILKGDTHKYSLSPDIKKFTLLDLNFTNTRNGNYEYIQSLNPDSPYLKKAIKLKIMINADLQAFKMSIVDGTGLNDVDIFSKANYAAEKEQFNFIMRNFMMRKVFVRN